MPAQHHIDSTNKLIITTWSGVATDSEFIDAITKYHQEVKRHPDYIAYNEIVDLSDIGTIKLTTEGLQRIGKLAAITDQEIQTKLALIVSSPLAYGLARMYEAYRNFSTNANKEIKVFQNESDAHKWIETNT